MRKVLYLFGILSERDVEWLVTHGQRRFVPANTTLIRQGEPLDALFILLEGRLSVRTAALGDREVAPLYPGEVLGEISFLDTGPPSASVVSVEASHVFVIDRDPLVAKLARDEGFAARFYRAVATFLADRLRTTTGHLGYGRWDEQPQADELTDDARFDDIALAARRFDDMLQRLCVK